MDKCRRVGDLLSVIELDIAQVRSGQIDTHILRSHLNLLRKYQKRRLTLEIETQIDIGLALVRCERVKSEDISKLIEIYDSIHSWLRSFIYAVRKPLLN